MAIQWHSISSEEELEAVLSGDGSFTGDSFLLLKHSNRCSISKVAKMRLEKNPDPRLSYFIIDVLGNRSVSDKLAEITGVQHESPQTFLYHAQQLIDVKSHMGISGSGISRQLDEVSQIGI